MGNSNIEVRNTKQIQMTKIQMLQTENSFEFRKLGFWICLGFRVSDLEFTRTTKGRY